MKAQFHKGVIFTHQPTYFSICQKKKCFYATFFNKFMKEKKYIFHTCIYTYTRAHTFLTNKYTHVVSIPFNYIKPNDISLTNIPLPSIIYCQNWFTFSSLPKNNYMYTNIGGRNVGCVYTHPTHTHIHTHENKKRIQMTNLEKS